MGDLTAGHYLNIYRTRLRMQEDGVTDPPAAIKELTRAVVKALSGRPPEEAITIEGETMMDASGNILIAFPDMTALKKPPGNERPF